MQKLKPYSYKLFRYVLIGEKDGIDVKVICDIVPPDIIHKKIKLFVDFLEKNKLVVGVLKGEKDFVLISVDKLWDKLYNKE